METMRGWGTHYFAVINMANRTCSSQTHGWRRHSPRLTNIHVRFGPLKDCRIGSSCKSIVSEDSIDRVCAS